MPRVSALQRRPRRKLVDVYIDGQPVLSLAPELAVRFRLSEGQVIGEERLEEIRREAEREKAMATALRLVAYRPRSEKELRDALTRRGIGPELRDRTIARVRELGLLDDRAFAATYVELRDRSSPRSRRLTAVELRAKGVAREVAGDAALAIDDADAAYRAAARRARSLTAMDLAQFEAKVGPLLLRRGFSYEVSKETVKRLWREREGDRRAL